MQPGLKLHNKKIQFRFLGTHGLWFSFASHLTINPIIGFSNLYSTVLKIGLTFFTNALTVCAYAVTLFTNAPTVCANALTFFPLVLTFCLSALTLSELKMWSSQLWLRFKQSQLGCVLVLSSKGWSMTPQCSERLPFIEQRPWFEVLAPLWAGQNKSVAHFSEFFSLKVLRCRHATRNVSRLRDF